MHKSLQISHYIFKDEMEREGREDTTTGTREFVKELSHGTLSYFGHVQNYIRIEGNTE